MNKSGRTGTVGGVRSEILRGVRGNWDRFLAIFYQRDRNPMRVIHQNIHDPTLHNDPTHQPHIGQPPSILLNFCSIHTKFDTWHLIYDFIVFQVLFRGKVQLAVKWKVGPLSHLPTTATSAASELSYNWSIFPKGSDARWHQNITVLLVLKPADARLCDWPKGGGWPMCGVMIDRIVLTLPRISDGPQGMSHTKTVNIEIILIARLANERHSL